MKRKHSNIAFYCRLGGRVYTLDELKRKWEREKVMKKMTPEQIAFCDKLKQELDSGQYVFAKSY